MTTPAYDAFQKEVQAIDARAKRLADRIIADARRTARAAGLSPEMPFLHAHNAMCSFEAGKPWPEVNYSLARKVLWLEQKSFEPSRLASALYKRAFNRYAAQFNMPLYSEEQIRRN